ncbi:unnamed protein product [Periconia digitata]|uniref:Uncharacterized protein n=1 Tax=Periconia digitata TaxID=1303443 RepID=A0A9W4UB75_9PLEO|nr:unnamed protein product [Periconia digitata]
MEANSLRIQSLVPTCRVNLYIFVNVHVCSDTFLIDEMVINWERELNLCWKSHHQSENPQISHIFRR